MENNQISYHNYADDLQMGITMWPGDDDPIRSLSKCIVQINDVPEYSTIKLR